MTLEEQQFLERVKAASEGEQAPGADTSQQHRRGSNLFIRNILNGLFILLAVVAMAGIAYAIWGGHEQVRTASYAVGIVAVFVKMVEASLRMTSMLRRPQENVKHRHYDKRRNNPS
ncbi:MAG: hypothetical protein IKR63_00915 [Alloprevotella sp.]|nr:hypothetical protein [Alloprevotella sp.]MBR6338679.1 hypothetical protein [Alloprevotella sp.]